MTTEPPPHTSGPASEEEGVAPRAEPAAPPPAGEPRRHGRLAIGTLQVIAMFGIVALAVIAGAILVDDTKVPGWIDGLAIGAGSVILTLVVVFNGRRAHRATRPRRRAR